MNKLKIIVGVCCLLSACSAFQSEPAKVQGSYYADDAERYRQNVAVKAETPDYVTYEYKDIRIDELAPLAAMYCDASGGRQAYLREIILYHNNLRRATFDCANLAMEE